MKSSLVIRPARPSDEPVVLEFLERTNFFRSGEIEIAREVFCEAAAKKPGCTYQSYVADSAGRAVGWVCFGATPCTAGTYDIYWIAVDPFFQGRKVGRALISYAEAEIRRQHGRLIVVETSGTKRYESTRAFYEKLGYVPAACIADFYAPGDEKRVYLKTL